MLQKFSSTTRWFVLATVLVLGLVGCSNKQQRTFQNTLDTYGSLIRWGDFAGALNFVHPDERPETKRMNFELQRFEQIRVTSYIPLSTTGGPSPNTVIQIVEMRVANRHTAQERQLRDRQVWQFDEEDERWWLMSGLPDISRQ